MEAEPGWERVEMPVYPRLTLIAALLGSVAPAQAVPIASQSGRSSDPGSPIACSANLPCSLSGTVIGQHREGTYSWAALDTGSSCTALLLPDDVYRAWRHWNGRQVRIDGTALARRPTAPDVVQIQYRDRWLSPIVCGDNNLVLYVKTIVRMR